MASLAKEIQERMAGIRGVLKATKSVASSLNKLNRLSRRLLNRRRALPDEQDLIDIVNAIKEVINITANLSRLPADLGNIFRI